MHDYQIICSNIEKASKESECANQGVAITVLYNPDQGYEYCIWAIGKAGISEQRLLASVTSYERLLAHVNGFCQNHTVIFA